MSLGTLGLGQTLSAQITGLTGSFKQYVIGLDDVIMHNAHDVMLVRKTEGTYRKDKYIAGTNVSVPIRGYIFTEKVERNFPEDGPGELDDHVLNLAVSTRWLNDNGIFIAVTDRIIHDLQYYSIIDYDDVHFKGNIRVYRLRKAIGFENITYPPLDEPILEPTQVRL